MRQSIIEDFRVLRVHPAGSSRPLVVESTGQLFFVKLKAGLSGSTAIISEWLCCQIGVEMGLPVLAPRLILLDETTAIDHIYIENRELIQKSFGLNIAFPFLEPATAVLQPYSNPDFVAIAKRLYIFDLLWLNIDRTLKNTNLLQAENRLVSFDYESSFLINGIAAGKDFFHSKQVLQHLRQNPLYADDIMEQDITDALQRLGNIDLSEIAHLTPLEWLNAIGVTAAALLAGLTHIFKDVSRYHTLLESVRHSPVETEEARKNRILANRMALEAALRDKQ